jgi:carboxymethylenebutenolidase
LAAELTVENTDKLLGGSLSRRAFLSRLALVAGGSAVALACGSEATAIAPTAPATSSPSPTAARPTNAPASTGGDSIEAGPIEFDADGETLLGYLSRPTLPGPHPAIVVVHENRGLLPHFQDITRRYAREGYVALAIDMLSRQGARTPSPMATRCEQPSAASRETRWFTTATPP